MIEVQKSGGDYCSLSLSCCDCPMDASGVGCGFNQSKLLEERNRNQTNGNIYFSIHNYGKTWKIQTTINPNFIEYVKKEIELKLPIKIKEYVKTKSGRVVYEFVDIKKGKAVCIPKVNFKSKKTVLISLDKLVKNDLQRGDIVRNGNGQALYKVLDLQNTQIKTEMVQDASGGTDFYSKYFTIKNTKVNKVEQ